MFDAIAPTYDLLNRLMSLGMDVNWRRRAVAECMRDSPKLVLDVGAGTGDVTLMAAQLGSTSRVVGVDFSLPMLRRAARRAAKTRRTATFTLGDAERLPIATGAADALVTAFTLRNVADLRTALLSFARVLAKGGRLVILEMTPMASGPLAVLFRFYFHRVVPLLGRMISRHAFAYTYLPRSVDHFPDAAALAGLIAACGFQQVSYSKLGLGSVAVHTAVRAG